MKKAFVMIAAMALALSLFGCAGNAGQNQNMAGTYIIDSVSDGTTKYDSATISTLNMSDLITMEIDENNAGTISVFGTDFNIAINPADSEVTLTVNDSSETIPCTIDGEKITFDVDGRSLTMAKQ